MGQKKCEQLGLPSHASIDGRGVRRKQKGVCRYYLRTPIVAAAITSRRRL
jgi:hypothetical protein